MSDYLPFRAHQRIHEEHQTTVFEPVNIGTLPVIMGFRALLDNGQARRIMAMPAYTQSASYEQEFLQTTTYLIAFYIIIFLFFTGLAWIVARNLTQPLAAFKTGLRQISSGELNTKIPVSSNDEIGELARAYNQMLDDLVALRKELAKVEREAAWSEMARQVAHEIKNPLTPMKLSIQHLQRQVNSGARSMEELKPSIERLTEMLVKQIDSLNKIASDFSAFAKPMNGTQVQVQLESTLSDILRLFEHHHHIHITTSFEDGPVYVMGIEDELRRVFINLITNAIEAMPEGGSLNLILELQPEQQQVKVSVIDTGNGIDGEIQDRIFTPNFSTKTSGTGLGLAISKKIIEAHGGKILFSSSKGNGTRFDVVLPHRPSA
jgi:nitrogen fixation/metabolism regulation signal transduction histidine kinase